ncbi:hypothetical protein ACPXB3_21545 [Gordonia sp. DT219]|uniref:hypothetical protein n=1 Tax=Gordonia sp. DT219 TaxID=3416658 RepID=UPI003CF7D01D
MLDFTGLPPLIDIGDIDVDGVTDADLEAVCEDIRIACGWHIAPLVQSTMVLDATGGTVLVVPSLKIGEPIAVKDSSGADITGWSWSSTGILEGSWPTGLRSVTVTADSGFDACPSSVKSVAVDMLRDRVNVAAGGGVAQVQLDDATILNANPFSPRGTSSDVGVRRDIMDAYGHILGRFALWDSH